MNRREHERRTRLEACLKSLGFTLDEVASLRRISNTLQRWHELECGTDGGWYVERETEDGDSPPHLKNSDTGRDHGRTPDRERGAKLHLARLFDEVNRARRTNMDGGGMAPLEPLSYYIQTDPRGCALYILRPDDVPAGEPVDSYYSRGIAVC